MKTLIVFCSTHGACEKAARMVGDLMTGKVDFADLDQVGNPDPGPYDAVIIGGSIHAGSIQRKVMKFIQSRGDVLSKKKLGLFLCCMYQGDKAIEQFEKAFPLSLREISASCGLFGWEFYFSKMNFLERSMVKMVSGTTQDVSNLDLEAIRNFAAGFTSAQGRE
ncbi:flavodoxin domain-containing protein [Cohnella silvisoli]|uniref:Flavodoxin domain-containing protein n=1 Tax=Cohnella silvisoli TaxID=2873699 RepID=A0ABV1KLH7_9BACL|nr:flavodoxin domain-containing protein [Cohnella silvisoli]MCD9020689.1 flavodoxin domain-containing protein [Cohnella silvisoli]